jgi:hypothetical protein
LAFIQHILLSMNAHINHDLAIAAATVSRGSQIIHINKAQDFSWLNAMEFSLLDDHQLDKFMQTITIPSLNF